MTAALRGGRAYQSAIAEATRPNTKNVSVKLPSTNAIALFIDVPLHSRARLAAVDRPLERAAKEPQHLRRGLRAVAPGLLDRLARPEMPRPRYDDGAGKEAGLLQRGQKCLRLRLRVDDVVIGAVDEQEARPRLLVLIDRGVADRRSVEIGAAALHGRHPEEFLGDLVARTGDLVVVPLRLHVVDAVEADDRLHVGGGSGVRVTAILSRKQGFIASERNQRH